MTSRSLEVWKIARKLSPDGQEILVSYARSLLDSEQNQEDLPLVQKKDREIVDRQVERGVSYQLELIKCGKPNCKCAKGKPHGPYWYAYYRENGKVKSKYIGKKLNRLMLQSDLDQGG